MSEKTQLNIGVDLALEYFQPEIVIDSRDDANPPLYLPYLPIAENEDIPQALVDSAWDKYDQDDPLVDAPPGDDVIYINLDANDNGDSALRLTPELKLARHGMATVRVYTPAEYEEVTNTFGFKEVKKVPLSSDEKMTAINSNNLPIEDCETLYQRDGATNPDSGFDERGGFFDSKPIEGFRDGRFSQLKQEKEGGKSTYVFSFTLGECEYQKSYVLSGVREFSGAQVRRVGRKRTIIREVLSFAGDTEKTIKYWYDDPIVRVISWTRFVDAKRNSVEWRPYNYGLDDGFWRGKTPLQNYVPRKGRTFRAKEPVWGDLIVEYETSYTEYEILYDYPNLRRPYEVSAGGVQQVGKTIFDYKDDIVEQSISLKGNNLGYDRTGQDKDWLRANKKKPGFDASKAPTVCLKLLKKIRMKPVKVPPIKLFYTNGRRTASATLSVAPDFMDLPRDEMPRIAIYEEMKRYRKYNTDATDNDEPYVEYERCIERCFVDPLGNLSRQRYERGDDEDDNRPVKA